MIFQSLIKKIEQGCGRKQFSRERSSFKKKVYDICGKRYFCECCVKERLLLKTLQKEVEEVLEDWVIQNQTSGSWLKRNGLKNGEELGNCIFLNYNNLNAIDGLKSSLENVGVKE